MYKHVISLALLLSLVYAGCNSPNFVKFQEGHKAFPSGDPKVSALTYPTVANRLSYGFYRTMCPGRPMKSLEKTANFLIGSNFVKNMASKSNIALASLSEVSDRLVGVLSSSLSPDALGYEGTKDAMESAIGTAISSGYSCESIEEASRLYFSYARDDYIADICNKKNTISVILKVLKKGKAQVNLVAVPYSPVERPYFIDIYSRNPHLGELVRQGKMARREALGRLVKDIDQLPLCHEVAEDYVAFLGDMANQDDPFFFDLYDAIVDFRNKCPLKFSGYFLERNDSGVLYFSNGSFEVPLLIVKSGVIEKYKEAPGRLNISGILPIKGNDRFFNTRDSGDTERRSTPPKKLNFSLIALVVLGGIILLGVWFNDKKK